MCFASFLYTGFITASVVNPPERKLAKRTSVQSIQFSIHLRVVKISSQTVFLNHPCQTFTTIVQSESWSWKPVAKSRDEKAFWEAEKWWTTMLVVLLLLLKVVQAVLPHLHCVKSCHLHLVLLACCAKSPPLHGVPGQNDKFRISITLVLSG